MQTKGNALKPFMIVIVLASTLWVIILFSAIGNIYISHGIPYSLSDWIVSVQIEGNYWPGQQPHSTLFYLARFYAFTAILICAGMFSAAYLKRVRQRRGTDTSFPISR
jgi:hypothetical protein